MSIALALLSALCWGCTDYLAGRAGRYTKSVTVTLNLQAIAVIMLVPIVLLGDWHPSANDLWLGLLAAFANAIGFTLFVEGASRFAMSIVVPISAVTGAAVPVVFALLLGEHLGLLSWLGIALGLGGIALISSEERKGRAPGASRLGGVEFGLLSGLAFGVIFVALSQTTRTSGMWPVLIMRASLVPLLAYALVKKAPLVAPSRLFPMLVVLCALAIAAVACFTVASRIGPLGVVAVLASMSPLFTLIIVHLFDRERVTQIQIYGIAASLVAIAFLTAG